MKKQESGDIFSKKANVVVGSKIAAVFLEGLVFVIIK